MIAYAPTTRGTESFEIRITYGPPPATTYGGTDVWLLGTYADVRDRFRSAIAKLDRDIEQFKKDAAKTVHLSRERTRAALQERKSLRLRGFNPELPQRIEKPKRKPWRKRACGDRWRVMI